MSRTHENEEDSLLSFHLGDEPRERGSRERERATERESEANRYAH